LKINITVTINTTKQLQYLPKISDVSAITVTFFQTDNSPLGVAAVATIQAVATKLFVIKEICYWLQTFCPSNRGDSQEHISLITNSFLIILLSSSNSSIKGISVLGFI